MNTYTTRPVAIRCDDCNKLDAPPTNGLCNDCLWKETR